MRVDVRNLWEMTLQLESLDMFEVRWEFSVLLDVEYEYQPEGEK